jgi:hypothetical protein
LILRTSVRSRISLILEKAVNPQMPQISTDETKDLRKADSRKALVHRLGDAQAADVRSLVCAHLRNLRIELLFLG